MAAKIEQTPSLRDTAIGLVGGGAAVVSGGATLTTGDPTTKVCRELYIGNMPEGVNEIGLVQFFNGEMNSRGWNNPSLVGNCCLQVTLSGNSN